MAKHNTQSKAFVCIAILALMLLVLPSAATGLGISPTEKRLEFSPGQHVELQLKVLNNENKDMKVLLYARGEMSDYVSFRDTLLTFSADEPMNIASLYLDLPDKLEKPGEHEVEIVALEYPKGYGEPNSGDAIKSSGAVVMKIYVRVPYPNKYAEAELQISASKIGEDVVFTVPVFNFGRQNIDGVSAEVEIYGPNNEKLGMAKAESISLAASQSGKLVARWRADVKPGIYHAVAMVDYDGQSAKAERDFDLGDLRVKATAIDVGNFRLGNVAKMDILLENLWNQPLKNVYGEVEVRDQSKSYTKFKTAGVDLEPYSKGMIISYWDTTGVPVGRYIVDVLLSYANQNTTDSFEVDVNLDTIRTAAMATGEVIESDKSKLGTSTAIVLLVIVIIALNIGWFVYKSRIKNKKR